MGALNHSLSLWERVRVRETLKGEMHPLSASE